MYPQQQYAGFDWPQVQGISRFMGELPVLGEGAVARQRANQLGISGILSRYRQQTLAETPYERWTSNLKSPRSQAFAFRRLAPQQRNWIQQRRQQRSLLDAMLSPED